MMFRRVIVVLAWVLGVGVGASFAAGQLGDLTGPWQLFVDDHLIASSEGVDRVYHAFEKHPASPVMVADKPWEGGIVYLYGTVLPAEDGPGYRMWYHSWDGSYRMLYATSRDGLRWEKPSLGLHAFEGSTDNNIFLQRTHEDHIPQVIHTPWETDPDRRYKLITYEYGRSSPKYPTSGFWAAWSSDGVHWVEPFSKPILPDPGDVGNFVWDPHRKRYLGYPKIFDQVRGYRRRCVGISETTDFEHWPATELILVPDEYDDRWVTKRIEQTDFYGMSGFAYESMYIGFLWIFRITDGVSDGPIFVELVTSRDGRIWERQAPPRDPVLPLGPEGAWDGGMVFTPNHPLVEGGAIRLYYGGFSATHGVDGGTAGIGLATLRKDGFASLDAGDAPGVVTTKPLEGCAGPLEVNFAAPDGSLRVEALDAAGDVIPGYGRDACAPLTGDHVQARVTWEGRDRLPDAAGPIRLRFVMRNAALYSFAAGGGVRVAAGNP